MLLGITFRSAGFSPDLHECIYGQVAYNGPAPVGASEPAPAIPHLYVRPLPTGRHAVQPQEDLGHG